jgi:hypothetical protein
MSVHKSTFWGPFFALVVFTICVGVIKSVDEWTEKRAEMEARRKINEAVYEAYKQNKAFTDSLDRARFVKDSTDKVRQKQIVEQRRIVATRNMNVEQCKMWAWSDTANFGNEEKAERDCIRRNNLLTN